MVCMLPKTIVEQRGKWSLVVMNSNHSINIDAQSHV